MREYWAVPKVWQIWEKFVKILPANSSRTFDHRKYLYKHKMKVHPGASYTQVSMYKNEGARADKAVRQIWDNFVKILLANSSKTAGHRKS